MRDDAHPKGAEAQALARLAAGFQALVAVTFALIVLGALVRAHDAGLACPDWPLCFGQVLPRMNLEIAFEWSHRALAGSVSLAFAALSAIALLAAGLSARRRVGGWIAPRSSCSSWRRSCWVRSRSGSSWPRGRSPSTCSRAMPSRPRCCWWPSVCGGASAPEPVAAAQRAVGHG